MSQWVKPLPHKCETLNLESYNPYEARKGRMFCNSIAPTVRSETELGESKEACGPVSLVYATAGTKRPHLEQGRCRGPTSKDVLSSPCVF